MNRLALLMVRSRASFRSAGGFTLVELLVGSLLLALVASMAGVLVGVSNRSTLLTEALANASSLVDSDVSRISRMAAEYTCCPGTCTIDAAVVATATAAGLCAGAIGDSSYYFPQREPERADFKLLCSNGLTAQLITDILALPQPAGMSRAVVDDDPFDPIDHRIRITYSGGDINRVVKIVPTVAGWCP